MKFPEHPCLYGWGTSVSSLLKPESPPLGGFLVSQVVPLSVVYVRTSTTGFLALGRGFAGDGREIGLAYQLVFDRYLPFSNAGG